MVGEKAYEAPGFAQWTFTGPPARDLLSPSSPGDRDQEWPG